MSERYTKLFALAENLYAENAPVIVCAGALFKDNQTGRLFCQVRMENLDVRQIRMLKLEVRCMDAIGRLIGSPLVHLYPDLHASCHECFGGKTPISIPDPATRSFSVCVREVAFEGGSVEALPASEWTVLPAQLPIKSYLSDPEDVADYKNSFGEEALFVFDRPMGLCRCTCGALHNGKAGSCYRCRCKFSMLDGVSASEFSKRFIEARADKLAAIGTSWSLVKAIELYTSLGARVGIAKKLSACNEQLLIARENEALAVEKKADSLAEADDSASIEEAIKLYFSLGTRDGVSAKLEACGEHLETVRERERKARARAKRTGIILSAAVVVVIIFVFLFNLLILPSIQYNGAIDLMKRGKYEEAIAEFESLDGFMDSRRMITDCENAIREKNYNAAVALKNEDKYEEAIFAFEALNGYKDSAELISACKSAILDRDYATAVALKNEGKYEEAISAFETLNGYKDSAELISACKTAILDGKYNDAVALMNAGRYTEAINSFEALDGYKDSADKINACNTAILDGKYNDAIALMDAGNITEAYEALVALDGYKDSTEKANSIYDEYKIEQLKVAKVGDYVFFGAYEQDNNTSNGKEDVEWLVLAKEGNKALVISKYALDCQQYNTSYANVTWETCSLRTWLNGTFLESAFSSAEQAMIATTTVSADKNPSYSTSPGNATQDKIFLLSVTEAEKYFSSDGARACEATAYAEAQGAYVNSSNGNCWWWLRSPCYSQKYAAGVYNFGSVDEFGNLVDDDDNAVRPALWIDLSITLRYNDALALKAEGKYEEAITAFEALNGYKDSAEQIAACKTAILDGKYNEAIALMDAGKYAEAINAFEALDGYKDSTTKITECNTAILDGKYNDAIALMDAGNIIEAYEALVALDGYKDSTEKANSIYAKNKIEELKVAKVGDYVFFGAYEQDNNTSNGKEDVEWLVLAKEGSKALIISKYALDCQRYNTSNIPVTWKNCSLRTWLNGTFLDNAFSSVEQAMIATTTVSADKNPSYSTSPGDATQDKIFLLSVTEVEKYFSSDGAGVCEATAYAKAQGAYVSSSNGNCWWWLRSPGYCQNMAAYVYHDGVIDENGDYVDRSNDAVRPALWIDLNE